MSLLYPNVTINVINTVISGDNTSNGLKRFERDVLAFNTDLIVISYGLNDACVFGDKKDEYINNLKGMILEAKKRGSSTV